MEGTCIDIWRKELLNEAEIARLKKYSRYFNIFSAFMIRFKNPDIRSEMEREQIGKVLGYLPQQSIQICTFLDVMFPAAIEIMRHFGGVIKYDLWYEGIEDPGLKGQKYKIETYVSNEEEEDDDDDDDETGRGYYYIIDQEFTENYLNADFPEEDWELLGIKNIDRIDIDKYPPRFSTFE